VNMFDRTVRMSSGGGDYFKLERSPALLSNHFGTNPQSVYSISWKHAHLGEMGMKISFYDNPQIDNGFSLTVFPNESTACVGLMMQNYKPKLMQVPKITTLEHKKLHARLLKSKNPLFQKTIVPKGEEWYSGDFKNKKALFTR
jgi:hypothetical protein